ncbi:hypothetical protein BD289DRAFT_456827 [Coniella lustricola]|uniref:Uncharacterized protein n=1 Tax=Coniella lustricola TaxID=2025994 RepID=A0A2T2ZUB6_9PEZI|nr:hypothetical protein BD289DRAFT_456827 [Coniella lustricola]
MDTLKKIIHPHKSSETSTSSSSNTTSELPPSARSNAETTVALGNEPNRTSADQLAANAPFDNNTNTHGHHNTHQHHAYEQHEHHNIHDHNTGALNEHQNKHPRVGHHHPRQDVGATGLPPNHQPRENFTSSGAGLGAAGVGAEAAATTQHHRHGHHSQQQQQQQQQPLGMTGADAGAGANATANIRGDKIAQAEAGNNFPGTNPHPAHSALGNRGADGETGMLMPGQE